MIGIGIKEMAFVGYPVHDIAESRKFYGEIIGLTEGMIFEQGGEIHWLEFQIPGGQTLAITKASEQWQPGAHGGGVCFEVEDLDAAVASLEKSGATFAIAPQDFPVCRLAVVFDPSGNTIALHQKKPHHPEYLHKSLV